VFKQKYIKISIIYVSNHIQILIYLNMYYLWKYIGPRVINCI